MAEKEGLLLYKKQNIRKIRERLRGNQTITDEAKHRVNQNMTRIFEFVMQKLKNNDYNLVKEKDVELAFKPFLCYAEYEKKLSAVEGMLSGLIGSIEKIQLDLKELKGEREL